MLSNLHEEIRWWLSRRKAQKAARTMKFQGLPRRPLTPYQRWLRGEGGISRNLPPARIILENAGGTVDALIERLEIAGPVHVGHKAADCAGEAIREGLRQVLLDRPTAWRIGNVMAPGPDGRLSLLLTQEFEKRNAIQNPRDDCVVYIGPEAAPLKFQLLIPFYDTLSKSGETTLRLSVKVSRRKGVVIRECKRG